MKKIMFNDKYGLTQAVLEGRKTMTRRVITIPEKWHGIDVYGFSHAKGAITIELINGDDFVIEDPNTGEVAQILPTYKVGEEVAVAQSYFNIYGERQIDGSIVQWCNANGKDFREEIRTMEALMETAGYDNKMFVRADLMPYHIKITDIKVERLQDISDEDCLREGVQAVEVQRAPRGFLYYGGGNAVPEDKKADIKSGRIYIAGGFKTPQQAFAKLIDRVSGKGTWDENPYVFAYEFELVK